MVNELFTTFQQQLARLKVAAGVKTDTALARVLGIGQGGVSNVKAKEVIPAKWFIKITNDFNVNYEWLISGTGPMRRDEAAVEQPADTMPEDAKDARIKELEAELAKSRQEAAEAKDEAIRAYRLAARYLPPPVGVVQEPVPAYGEKGTDPARTPPPQAPHKRPDEGC